MRLCKCKRKRTYGYAVRWYGYSTGYGYRPSKEYISVSLSDFATSADAGPTGPVQVTPQKAFLALLIDEEL